MRAVDAEGSRVLVYNPLPWSRSGIVEIDGTTFLANNIPAHGYRTFPPPPAIVSKSLSGNKLENEFISVSLDPVRGVIASLVEKRTGREWVDGSAEYGLGQYLNERFESLQTEDYCRAYQQGRWGTHLHPGMYKPGLPAGVRYRRASGVNGSMPTPFANVTPLNLSRDNSEMLVGSFTGAEVDQQIWALPVLGGSPRRVSDSTGWDATWSPNGNLLIARSNELLEVSSGNTRRFGPLPDYSYWFRWSPDGQALRFTVSEASGSSSVWELSSSGGNLHRVLPELAGKHHQKGTWTPDGRYFVFQALEQNRMDLWATRERGDWFHKVDHRPVRLTSGPMSFRGAQPSPDGKRIYAVGEQSRSELVRYDAKSGQFLPYFEGAPIGDVTFSRDGNWLAYVTYPDGILWRSRVDGTQKLQLTSAGQSGVFLPSWSPDGKQIVFSGGEGTKHG